MTDILIIEDNGDIARGLRDNLEVEGYEVELASDGEQGLARVRGRPPRLVILDLMLPRIDGIQVLRRLRDEGFEMPVLILSARAPNIGCERRDRMNKHRVVIKTGVKAGDGVIGSGT